MSSDIKIMTDLEISLLQTRRAANPDLLVDPMIVDRLVTTLLFFRNAAAQFESDLDGASRRPSAPEYRRRMW